jgi:hypothetical protein
MNLHIPLHNIRNEPICYRNITTPGAGKEKKPQGLTGIVGD